MNAVYLTAIIPSPNISILTVTNYPIYCKNRNENETTFISLTPHIYTQINIEIESANQCIENK